MDLYRGKRREEMRRGEERREKKRRGEEGRGGEGRGEERKGEEKRLRCVWYSSDSDAHHFAHILLPITQPCYNSFTIKGLRDTILLYAQILLSAQEENKHRDW